MKAVLMSTQCGDWEALYVDGVCVRQCHKFTPSELLEYAGTHGFTHMELAIRELSDPDDEEAEECGRMPERLENLIEPPTDV